MHRSVSRLLVFAVTFTVTLLGADKKASSEWTSSPEQSARIRKIERSLAPIEFGGKSQQLDMKGWMDLYNVRGLSVAVFDNFQIVWAKAYGMKDVSKSEPVTLDTLFQAGSISKPVTAMAVLHYVEAGKFNLDTNINDYLTSWKLPENEFTATQKVTLRRLLSHSAGTTVHGFPGYTTNERMPTLVQVLNGEKPANTAPVRVDFTPGSKTRYSGGGTTIVQLALVDQLKKPFPEIMRETVISKLNLKNSTYEQPLPANRAAMAATGYRGNGDAIAGKWHVYPEMAAAGLWTTPTDLATIAIEVAKSKAGKSNRILSQKMTEQMLTQQAEDVGLGFFVNPKTDRFGHNGADEGFQANLIAYSDTGRGVAIMANSDNGIAMSQVLVSAIAKEYGWPEFADWKPGVSAVLAYAKKSGGVDGVVSEFRRLKGSLPEKQFNPGQLNAIGYEYLRGDKKPADAIKVFKLNVEMYPKDSNAYDSLGEGYMEAGQKELAIENYRKSLELDPKNENAVTMLKKMGVEWKPPAQQ